MLRLLSKRASLLIIAFPVLILAGCSDSLDVRRRHRHRASPPPPSSLARRSAPLSRRRRSPTCKTSRRGAKARRPKPRPRSSRPRRKTRTKPLAGRFLPQGPLLWFKCPPVRHGIARRGTAGQTREQRFPQNQAASALRLRAGQQAQGAGPRARRRHHRFRHGQSRHADAGSYRAEAGRDDPRSAHQPLFGLARHPGLAPGARRLLRAPLRREAQSRDADRRDARLQGRLRQHGAGHHRTGRCHSRAEPDLSDPRVRLHHVRRRDPASAGLDQLGLHDVAEQGGEAFGAEAARRSC